MSRLHNKVLYMEDSKDFDPASSFPHRPADLSTMSNQAITVIIAASLHEIVGT